MIWKHVFRENFNQCLFLGFVTWAIFISPLIHFSFSAHNQIMLYVILPLLNGCICFGIVWIWRKILHKLPTGRLGLQIPPFSVEILALLTGILCAFAVFDTIAFALGFFVAFLTIAKIREFIRRMRFFLPPHHYVTRRELFVFLSFFVDLIIFFTLLNLMFQIIDNPVITASEDILKTPSLPILRSDNLFNALYFTVITLTTVGYGDFIPLSYFGKMIVVLECLTTYVMFGLMIGLIARGIRPIRTPFSPIRLRHRQKHFVRHQK